MSTYFSSRTLSSPNRPPFYAAAAAAIVTLQLSLIWTHVPWHDELQAVLLARDTNTLSAWYTNFRYEGHPPLWHLLLKLMLVFFDPPSALRAAASVTALTTAWLIFHKSPFAHWAKLALGLNYFLFFEYAVIARGYALGVVFLLAAIAFRARPIAWLFAALIPQAGAQMIFLPGFFAAIMFTQKRWSWPGVALCLLGATLAFVWMAPPQDVETTNMLLRDLPFVTRALRTVLLATNVIFPLNIDGSLAGWSGNSPFSIFLTILTGFLMPALVWAAARGSALQAAAAAGFALLTCLLSLLAYGLSLRHFGFIVITVIACQWVAVEQGKPLNRLAALWFAILAVSGLGAAVVEVSTPFAASRMMADHVARTVEPDRLLIPVDTLLGVEITAFTGRSTYNVTNRCLQTFVQWKGPVFMPGEWQDPPITPESEARMRQGLDTMKAAAARAGGKALLIFGGQSIEFHLIADDPALRFERFFHVGGPLGRMDRYLYRLDVPPDPNPAPIPPCIR
jgi:hypothetical protein